MSHILASASFTDPGISNRPAKVFFDEDGEYLGMTQQTTIANMPERLALKVKSMLTDYTIVDVIE